MKKNKSPGPDGFNVNFFLHCWDIVGDGFTKAVKFFFSTCRMNKGFNSTAIALVPKCANPSNMADFRPIACCNTIYKCIAKVLSNRLKEVLPSIIDKAQSAFIRGRSISDNILLAQELFRNYHRSSGPPRCALKIDLRKAFDTVSWDFLFDTLNYFKFPTAFIDWIKPCITTAMFSIKVNGSLAGYFNSSRGLRQGDPLSPYLFVIIMEMLSIKLNHATLQSDFKFHWRTKDCNLTHLLFADDIIIFCHANLPSVSIINSCIHSFSMFSGLIPNVQKSQCFLANTDMPTSQNILCLLGFSPGNLPAKFLGVPLISTKLSFHDCTPLIHRITQRITSWTTSVLAYSGRLQLIQSVLFSIQSYWSNHFLLPKAVIRSIQSLLCRFLWKGCSLGRHGAKVAWTQISLPKSEGGLGLKNILDWNKSLLLLHFLRILPHDPPTLWAAWVKRTILKRKSIWQIPLPPDCSWIWKQVLKLRPLALQHIKYNVGRGDSTSLWYDPWINGAAIHPSQSLIHNSRLHDQALVSDILHNSAWSLPQSNHHDVIIFRRMFDDIPPPSPTEDCILWDNLNIKFLKARHIWDSIRHRQQKVNWHTIAWHNLHVPRYSFMLWLGLLGKIQTNDRTMHYTGRALACPLCQNQPETFTHLFFECEYSKIILGTALQLGDWTTIPMSWAGLISFITNFQGTKLSKNIISLSVAVSIYKVWEARNSKLHNDTMVPPHKLAQDVIHIIKSRLSKCNSYLKATNFCSYYCNWLL